MQFAMSLEVQPEDIIESFQVNTNFKKKLELILIKGSGLFRAQRNDTTAQASSKPFISGKESIDQKDACLKIEEVESIISNLDELFVT